MQQISRSNTALPTTVVFTTSASTTGGVNMASYAGGTLLVSATSTGSAVTLTFVTKASSSDEASFVVADSTNTPVALEVQAGRAYPLPDELFSCSWVMATTSTGTATCQVVVKA